MLKIFQKEKILDKPEYKELKDSLDDFNKKVRTLEEGQRHFALLLQYIADIKQKVKN